MHSSNGNAQTTPAPRSRNLRDTGRGRVDRRIDEDVEEMAIRVPEGSDRKATACRQIPSMQQSCSVCRPRLGSIVDGHGIWNMSATFQCQCYRAAARIYNNRRTPVERLPTTDQRNARMPCVATQSVHAKKSAVLMRILRNTADSGFIAPEALAFQAGQIRRKGLESACHRERS